MSSVWSTAAGWSVSLATVMSDAMYGTSTQNTLSENLEMSADNSQSVLNTDYKLTANTEVH